MVRSSISACTMLLIFNAFSSAQLSITSVNTAFSQNFDAIGTSADLTVLNGANGWRIGFSAAPTFSGGTSTLGAIQSATLTGTSGGNSYNFRDGNNTNDRAVGFLNSSSFASPRSLMVQLANNTGTTVTELQVNWDWEKYRTGTREFNGRFYTSTDGTTWNEQALGLQNFPADASNAGLATPTVVSKSLLLSGLNLSDSSPFFLRFELAGVGGSTNGQGWGIDNFQVVANPVPEPASLIAVAAAGLGAVTWRRRRKA